MLIEVIKSRVPYLGVRGQQLDIPKNEAELHIRLGNAKAATDPPRKRRVYKRKDIQAAPQKVVVEPEEQAEDSAVAESEPTTDVETEEAEE